MDLMPSATSPIAPAVAGPSSSRIGPKLWPIEAIAACTRGPDRPLMIVDSKWETAGAIRPNVSCRDGSSSWNAWSASAARRIHVSWKGPLISFRSPPTSVFRREKVRRTSAYPAWAFNPMPASAPPSTTVRPSPATAAASGSRAMAFAVPTTHSGPALASCAPAAFRVRKVVDPLSCISWKPSRAVPVRSPCVFRRLFNASL